MVRITFLRHAESLANVAERKKTLVGYFKLLTLKDPPLSPAGIQQCVDYGLTHAAPDLLISSPLQRAVQTARWIWPNAKVVIAPYLLELGNYSQNKPANQMFEAQKGNLVLFIDWLKAFLQNNARIGRVVIVTHSLLMKHDLKLKSKPKNLESVSCNI
jgi:phosphohistidine phosphatase SixA